MIRPWLSFRLMSSDRRTRLKIDKKRSTRVPCVRALPAIPIQLAAERPVCNPAGDPIHPSKVTWPTPVYGSRDIWNTSLTLGKSLEMHIVFADVVSRDKDGPGRC